jgi:hypothetical protein
MASARTRTIDAPPNALPAGTRLNEFELRGVIGVGGFGIVYLAFDHALEREVAIKEYMPASLVGRTETMQVSLHSRSDAETFQLGLKSFVNEARLLARFDHPSLLKVHRFWEANNTAYMAMPVLHGRNLKEVRAETGPPDEAWLRALLVPLLGAIERLHAEGVYHRDIAPDNIQVEPDGRPVLMDFGAARRVIGDRSQTLTAILKPAYAPIEQYAEAGAVKQGPWTDLYSLGATVHYLLLGRPPAQSTVRAIHDDAQPLFTMKLPGCSAGFLQAIDWMLAPRPADRPQSVAELRGALDGVLPATRPEPPPEGWERTAVLGAEAVPPTRGAARPAAAPAVAPVAARADAFAPTTITPRAERTAVVPPTSAAAPPAARSAAPPAPAIAAPAPAAKATPATLAPAAKSKVAFVGIGLAIGAALLAVMVATGGGSREPAAEAAASAALAASAPGPAGPITVPAVPLPDPKVEAAVDALQTGAAVAPAATTAPAAPGTTAGTAAPGTTAGTAVPGTTASRPPRPAAPSATPAATPTAGSAGATVPTRAADATPVAAPPVAAPAAVASAAPLRPAPPVPAALQAPSERCSGRVLLALWLCVERECGRPELQSHPECVKLREEQEKRANPVR